MNSIVRSTFGVVSAAMLLVACDTSPTEVRPADDVATGLPSARLERQVEEALYDMTDTFFAARCGEEDVVELVRMEGSIYEKLVWFQDAAGQHHITHHTMPVGLRGVGVESGEHYRVAAGEHATYNQLMSGMTGSYRQILRMTATTSGTRFYMVFRGHYAIDEDNGVKVERERFEIGCSAI